MRLIAVNDVAGKIHYLNVDAVVRVGPPLTYEDGLSNARIDFVDGKSLAVRQTVEEIIDNLDP